MPSAAAAVWYGPEQGFQLTDVPLPQLAAGEVLVRNRAVTLCGSDLHTIAGDRDTDLPTVLGHEMVGEVVATGGPVTAEDGTALAPGTRVTWTIGASCGRCPRCARDLPQKCAALRKYGHARMAGRWQLSGGLATHTHLLPGTGIVAVPPGLADAVAAPANCATATVVCAVRRLDVGAGDTALVMGCGMLGLTAVSYLRSIGVTEVLASDVDPARRVLAAKLGATAAAPEDLGDLVRAVTAGEGVAVAVDLSGSNAAITSALGLLAIGGRLGLVGSVFPTPGLGRPGTPAADRHRRPQLRGCRPRGGRPLSRPVSRTGPLRRLRGRLVRPGPAGRRRRIRGRATPTSRDAHPRRMKPEEPDAGH